MNNGLYVFQKIASRLAILAKNSDESNASHPFDERNIHPKLVTVSKKLFDDGHYAQATFEAFKQIDIIVKKYSSVHDSGFKLMMNAFSETTPKIRLTALGSISEIDEQMGYKHIFAGAMSAIRNPRGHDHIHDTIDVCLDHLSFASVLLRRIDQAGYK